jgi:heptosyltransferase-2
VKLLVRVPNWLGDAVMCIPALAATRARWPQAEITLLGRPAVSELFAGQGLADRLVIFAHEGRHGGWLGAGRLASGLRGEKYDCALLLQNAFAAAWIAWRAGIGERIGYARDARSWLLTKAIPVPQPGETPVHECYYYLELLRRAGWISELPEVKEIRLRVSDDARLKAQVTLAAAGSSATPKRIRVALAPGAAYGSAKCWPVERYAALADRLIREVAADVILFGAPSERGVASRIAAAMQEKPLVLAGQTRSGDLPGLFAACDLFIGNDSGAMHVAAAVGLPVVAIFGPTDPHGTAPVTPRCTLVQQRVACSPCFLRHCPIDHRCMTRVDVQSVFAAARSWLEQKTEKGITRLA